MKTPPIELDRSFRLPTASTKVKATNTPVPHTIYFTGTEIALTYESIIKPNGVEIHHLTTSQPGKVKVKLSSGYYHKFEKNRELGEGTVENGRLWIPSARHPAVTNPQFEFIFYGPHDPYDPYDQEETGKSLGERAKDTVLSARKKLEGITRRAEEIRTRVDLLYRFLSQSTKRKTDKPNKKD